MLKSILSCQADSILEWDISWSGVVGGWFKGELAPHMCVWAPPFYVSSRDASDGMWRSLLGQLGWYWGVQEEKRFRASIKHSVNSFNPTVFKGFNKGIWSEKHRRHVVFNFSIIHVHGSIVNRFFSSIKSYFVNQHHWEFFFLACWCSFPPADGNIPQSNSSLSFWEHTAKEDCSAKNNLLKFNFSIMWLKKKLVISESLQASDFTLACRVTGTWQRNVLVVLFSTFSDLTPFLSGECPPPHSSDAFSGWLGTSETLQP